MRRYVLLISLFLFAIRLFAQTTILSDGFESGKGSWIFSGSGGNSYTLITTDGYNSANCIRNKYIYSPNYIISPAVTFGAGKAYKVRFVAKIATASNTSRKIEVYYNSSPTSDANEVYVGRTATLNATYTSFTLDNMVNPPAGTKYIILKVIDTGAAPTYLFCYIDNFELIETGNFLPTVAITSPANNYTHTAGTSLPVSVTAADADGTVSKVNLYYRGELLGSLTTPPYNFTIPNLPIGTSALYAKAYDNAGDSTMTATMNVLGVNVAPTCTLTAPAGPISINQGAVVALSASATDTDGTVNEVSFFVNGSKVSTDQTAPYSFDWSDPNPGAYNVYAISTDNTGLSTTSDTLVITSNPITTGYLITESFEDSAPDWVFSATAGGNEWKVYDGEGVNGTKAMRRKSSVDKNFIRYSTPLYFSAGTFSVAFSAKASTTASGYKLEAALIAGTDTTWSTLSAEFGTSYGQQTLTLVCPIGGYYTFLFRFRPLVNQTWKYLWVDDILVSGPGGFPNAEPIVKILTPTNSAEVAINTAIDLTSFAYDMDGTIAKVEYFIENSKIGESSAAPFTVSWTPTFSGVFSMKAKATDNGGKSTTKVLSVLVNYADRKVYDFVASSYLGGEAGSGKVWGTKVLSDGVIVLACDWGTVIPDGAVLHLLNGATINSRGAVVRISADGKTVLSVTKIGAYAVDLAIDDNDNIYVAAGTSGLVKVNRLADQLVLSKTFAQNVYRLDAGKTGYMVVLTLPGVDFDGKKWANVTVNVMNPAGNLLTSFGGASQYTNDVCIDEASQSAVEVGWKNVYTSDGVSPSLPVDIPGFKIYSFAGTKKFDGYNWSSDRTSPNWINRSENNMADTRIARVSMGDDGLLYFMAEVSGGNHPLRYSPYDIMSKVRFVGGDNYHTLSNVGTEFHTYVARMNIATGGWIEGQSFTARQTSGAGNTIDPEHGNVAADEDGRVYFTGKSFYGTPLSREILPEISYNGGALIYIMNPTLQTRELVDRVVQKNGGRDIAVRKFANHDKTIVYGGDVAFTAGQPLNSYLYLKNPVQNTFYGVADQAAGFYAVIGGTTPLTYPVTVDGVSLGSFTEGTKLSITAPATNAGKAFAKWMDGASYITDSTAFNAVLSVPGRAITVTSTYGTTATDYFRTKASGNWADLATWESSVDNASWIGATLAPTSSAAAIQVLVGHEVTVAAAATASTLTVNAGGKLTLNAGIPLAATNLNLKSSVADGTATFIDLDGTLSVTNPPTVEQYLTTGRNWYVSSPVSAATSNVFAANATNPVYYYVETVPNAWSQITNTSTDLTIGKGYIANITSDRVVTFNGGSLNTGAQSITGLTSGGASQTGCNLVGNPYPSYLKWGNASLTNVGTSIWYRSRSTGSYLFQTYNRAGGASVNGGSNLIPPMQAFWVKVAAGQTGSIGFVNADRDHADQTMSANRLKAYSQNTPKQLRLQVSNAVYADEALIYANTNASDGYDTYDSDKMFANSAAVPEIYTVLDNEKLAINGVNDFSENQLMALGFKTTVANTFSIKASEVRNFPADAKIILKDALKPNDEFDLTNGAAYSFTLDVTNDVSRFSLIFRASGGTTGVSKTEKMNAQVFMNTANQISILAPESCTYAVYNLVGQKLAEGRATATQLLLQSGVYMVKVTENGRNFMAKVVVD